jgi:hypothetical protein
MTHALAMFVGAIMFRGRTEPGRHRSHRDDEISLTRADRGLRRPVPGDPAMIEDDYFRFRNAPRD